MPVEVIITFIFFVANKNTKEVWFFFFLAKEITDKKEIIGSYWILVVIYSKSLLLEK